jgi:hypothetical protein
MMTDAEALKTLAQEDPAVADDARNALRTLTSGAGLGAISLLKLQEFLWYGLPAGTGHPPATGSSAGTAQRGGPAHPGSTDRPAAAHLAVARALARLFTLAGMDRYAEACASADTSRIISSYASSRAEGIAAYARALSRSHAVPPDTDLLAWSTVMGPDERAAYDASAAAIELAVAASELKVGVSGWKTRRAILVESWLTRPTNDPGSDTWLSRISSERIEEWAHGHPGERSRLARAVLPRLMEPPDLPDEPLPTLSWLLGHASNGLRLTARHYVAPTLVGEAAGRFGWGTPAPGRAANDRRHQELDVYPLHTLRGLAQHEMGAIRRSGAALVLTRMGRLMVDDAAVRWHIGTASLIGPDDGTDPDFTVAVREAALLLITLHDSPVGYEELASRLTELHAVEGWASRSGGSLAGAVRGEIHVLRHRLRALQLLDEKAPVGSVALTSVGTAAALSGLLARALRPRRHERP